MEGMWKGEVSFSTGCTGSSGASEPPQVGVLCDGHGFVLYTVQSWGGLWENHHLGEGSLQLRLLMARVLH
jgi:hypothetical protein